MRNPIVLPPRYRGLTLVEVLVTVVVISVGLLGAVALQLTTLRINHDAYVRSQAAVLTADILDRMRANRGAALDGDYQIDFDEPPGTGSTAQMDLAAWKATLAAQLPGGAGAVDNFVVDPESNRVRVVRVRIRWGERGNNDGVEFATNSSI